MILFSDPEFIPNEITIINSLFKEGLETFHLRKPNANRLEMSTIISGIDSCYHSRIMIHSHYDLLDLFQLKGIHFTEKTKMKILDFVENECIKSLGVHEISELSAVDKSINYVFLSPIFPSVSKSDYSKVWDFELVKKELSISRNFKIVALGGITLQNFQDVKSFGFDDFAVLGSIWEPIKSGMDISEVIKIFKKFQYEY